MTFTRTKITPALAREWLEQIPKHQRRVDKGLVTRITTAILAGEWRENGATIVFNRSDECIDGQHRLHAILAADRPVWALIVHAVDNSEETFQTIDDGKARTISDFIQCGNANHVAAVARFFWLAVNEQNPDRQTKPPIRDCIKLAEPYLERMKESASVVREAAKVAGVGSFLGFLWFYYIDILKLEESKITEFFARLGDGIGLSPGSPVLAIRNRCLRKMKNERIDRKVMLALVLKALNAHVTGRRLEKITFDSGKEDFPAFYGSSVKRPQKESAKETHTTSSSRTHLNA